MKQSSPHARQHGNARETEPDRNKRFRGIATLAPHLHEQNRITPLHGPRTHAPCSTQTP